MIEVIDRQVFNLEQELSSTEASLSEVEFDFDNAMTSIEALNQNKAMLENRIAQQEAELTNLYAQVTALNTTIVELESKLEVPISDTLLPFNDHYDADITY